MSHSDRMIDGGYWDIADLSNYLKVKIKTLYAMISKIPHYRVGKLIRFKKQEIDTWMENKSSGAIDGTYKERKIRVSTDIDKMIRKAIDQSKNEDYNSLHGKSDRIGGPKKEINNGSI